MRQYCILGTSGKDLPALPCLVARGLIFTQHAHVHCQLGRVFFDILTVQHSPSHRPPSRVNTTQGHMCGWPI